MRTTLQIDDDVYRAARSLAEAQGRAIGRVLSDLARKGLRPQPRLHEEGGFPLVEVPADSPPVAPEMIRETLEEEW